MSSWTNLDFWAPAVANWKEMQHMVNRFVMLGLDIYEWCDAPESFNTEYIEKLFMFKGAGLFFHHRSLGYLGLQCAARDLNHYGDPVKFTVMSSNGKIIGNTTSQNSVYMKNNTFAIPTILTIIHYCNKLWEIETSEMVNIKNTRHPTLITTPDERQRKTMENLFEKVRGGVPVIFANRNVRDNIEISAIKTDAPFIADKLHTYYHDTENELLTILGVDNSNREKKERVSVPEVNSNNELIDLSADVGLHMRNHACDQINKMFDLEKPMYVRFRHSVKQEGVQSDGYTEGANRIGERAS